MKKISLLISLLLICVNAEAATKTFGAVAGNWSDGTKWVEGSKPAADDDVVFTIASASCTVDESTSNLNSLNMTGYLGTLAFSSRNLNIKPATGTTAPCIFAGTVTWTSGYINFKPAGTGKVQLTTNGVILPTFFLNSVSGELELQDSLTITGNISNLAGTFDPNGQTVIMTGLNPSISATAPISFYNLTRTGTAIAGDSLTLSGNITVTNILTLSGNSSVNRLLVTSNTLGTARTITNTGATMTWSNVDFRDIALSTAYNASGITGGSGNCGGNTNITFTTADDWYWNGSGTRNFSDYTYWYTATNGGGSQMAATACPLPQDTCYFDANSIDGATIINQDLPRIPSIDFTGVAAMWFNADNLSHTMYGSLKLVDNCTYDTSVTYPLTFEGRGAYQFLQNDDTIKCNININMIGGSLTLLSNFIGTTCTLTLNNGTFDADTYNVTAGKFNSSNSNARTLLMGSGTWTVNNTTATTVWDMATITNLTNPTTMGETSTIVCGVNDPDAQTFAGGGCTYNNLTVTGGNTQIITLTGSNTFNVFTINAPKTVKFTSGTTQTVNSFVATGTAVNGIDLQATTVNVIATISDANGGQNLNDYLDVLDIVATQANTFYYGSNGSADAESTNWLANPTGAVGQVIMIRRK